VRPPHGWPSGQSEASVRHARPGRRCLPL